MVRQSAKLLKLTPLITERLNQNAVGCFVNVFLARPLVGNVAVERPAVVNLLRLCRVQKLLMMMLKLDNLKHQYKLCVLNVV